uniref:Nucleolar protein 56 n=1 Tax=Pinguiococcus pyrenoidosus TaxID=172671 RepID=A0A7R9YF44_9STRA|mmetsp:Transcript_5949/g.23069  ORF Transcript_5949/g.23069 Transcript_5949/m.23069 type:complete len:556 (+) Transcript_5949:185-1852(+)
MASGGTYILFESASGFAVFEAVEFEEIGSGTAEVQEAVSDVARFGRAVKLKGFQPFTSPENALMNINAVSEHVLSPDLKAFLEMNVPKTGKKKSKSKIVLGVAAAPLASAISEGLGIPCRADDIVREIVRGIRQHFTTYISELSKGRLEQAQLGLGHSYSRAKVKFNPGRSDNMIIQTIALLDQLDKDINTFAMRVREWYSWHFPELKDIVKDNYIFARCAAFIGDRTKLTEEKADELRSITMEDDLADAIIVAAKRSIGMDCSELDMVNIVMFTSRMVSLAEYRKQLHEYLVDKMATVAPNLTELLGEMVAARLIAKAGSLTNLAKCPASTVQILGAEKALFRALKTKGNTPKYGLIYHSTFIGRAAAKDKGRISRYLANKCAIASRIDSFIDEPTTKYGAMMREQVEERLRFYETGEPPRKNVEVMSLVSAELSAERAAAEAKMDEDEPDEEEEAEAAEESGEPSGGGESNKEKKKKKKKADSAKKAKGKKRKLSETPEGPDADASETPKKKKKKKSDGSGSAKSTPGSASAKADPSPAKSSSKKKKPKKKAA